ncbi:trans-1,2-dihydrobenzene-1,2-diol dehydrogenase-like [Portunus trituberculatus]|uniref:trans-1,2-dihydrobenzene-1,2-diol dehydrogenase-like n=1 Tax=Portunus trituberculatus TaxID=210409 RepID=UPI001E1D0EE8|nr:trans-1,2-dihydrobenzene-1,2-diol dehydrogenase-like [Portunus trituberculatus]
MATRWGIISAGIISTDFVSAMQVLPKEEHQVVAVAARSLQDARNFATKFGIESAYGSYSEVAKDPKVDVVYIGTIQTYHLPVATEMMKAGKAVLCEKPLCMNVRETRQLIQTAQECGVFFMEAVWSRFFPAYKELSRRLKDGEIGEVVQVIASFGQDLPHVERLKRPETGGGVTLDIGIYPVQLTTLAMGGDKPLKVFAGGHLNKNGVDETISASLVYSDGRVASVSASMRANLPSEAFIVGTKGTIKVHYPMWSPEVIEGPWGKSTHPLPKNSFKFNLINSGGLMYQAVEVRRCLKEGLLESPGMSHAESITLAEVMEQIRTQVGTVYPQDSM